MKVRYMFVLVSFAVVAILNRATVAQEVLETRNLRLAIGKDGMMKNLVAKPSDTEYGWITEPGPMALVYRGKQQFPASGVALDGNRLVVRFSKANVTATYEVIQRQDYLALKLLGLEGEPVDRIDLLQLKVKKLAYRGPWINVNYDDSFGICLCAGNIKTNAGMAQHEDHVVMRATAHKEVALEGTIAVLFGCPDPKNKFLDVMEVVERDFKMPSGAKNRRSPVQRYSYYWAMRPTPGNVHEHIKWAKRGGFRMILFSYTAFSKGAGHFVWNDRYSNGMADLKKVADAIRDAGLTVGLHTHYNKALKTDPYVTPVPDERLHKVRAFTLAAAVDRKANTIIVNENPKGCMLDDRRRILEAGKELIAYKGYTTEPPFQFTGCERGHLKTTPVAHRAGDPVNLLDVDEWPIFIRFDQDTDIQDETAQRIADIYHQTGPYDMVYFDGAEDVHAPFWYHVANAQYRVYRHFQPEPPVCEAAITSHFSWHMMSRSNAYDSVSHDKMKLFCRAVPYRAAPARARDFSRIDFGWLSGFGRNVHNYIGPDTLEYILSRGAAWDCPFSLLVTEKQLASNPRAEDCFEVIKIWEDTRIENKLTDAQLAMLRNLGEEYPPFISAWGCFNVRADMQKRKRSAGASALLKNVGEEPIPLLTAAQRKMFHNLEEHHLFINEKGEHELVAIHEIPGVANDVFKVYSFRRIGYPNDTYVLIWAIADEADLLLPVAPDRLTVMRPFGTGLPVGTDGGKAVVRVADREYLVLAGMREDQTREVFHKAKWQFREVTSCLAEKQR